MRREHSRLHGESLRTRAALSDCEISQRHADWQASVVDLREYEDRPGHVAEREKPRRAPTHEIPAELREIERQIEHIRLVLKDLAANRYRESLELAESVIRSATPALVHDHSACEASAGLSRRVADLETTIHRIESATMSCCHCQSRARATCSEAELLEGGEATLLAMLRRLVTKRAACVERMQRDSRGFVGDPLRSGEFCECCGERRSAGNWFSVTTNDGWGIETHAEPRQDGRWQSLSSESTRRWTAWQTAIDLRSGIEREIRAWSLAHEQLHSDPSHHDFDDAILSVEQELADARSNWKALLEVEDALRESDRRERTQRLPNRILQEASAYLSALTAGRLTRFELEPVSHRLRPRGESNTAIATTVLSRGTMAQAVLAFRLALVNEYSRRGMEFPVVLDDVLVDSDEPRSRAAAGLLQDFTNRGIQLVFLTSQEHLAELFVASGAALHRLEPAITAPVAKPIEMPAAETLLAIEAEPSPPIEQDDTVVYAAGEPSLWSLGLSSSLRFIPSMTPDAADRLEGAGFCTVGDVLQLSDRLTRLELSNLKITPLDLSMWQPEARLLCCVPHLDGRDAQLIVGCGVASVSELADFRSEGLFQRVQRFRGSAPYAWHRWVQTRTTWPRESDVADWIGWARRARSLAESEPAGRVPVELIDVQTVSNPNEPAVRNDAANPKVETPRRRSRRERQPGRRPRESRPARAQSSNGPRYYLTHESAIVDAPSIGPKLERILKRIDIVTVSHLINRDAAEVASKLEKHRISSEMVADWQDQCRLMCEVPGLRGHDAQILVATGIRTSGALAERQPHDLLKVVVPFAESKDGQRLLRSAAAPDLDEITQWVQAAMSVCSNRAA
jgi:hypothetical protein